MRSRVPWRWILEKSGSMSLDTSKNSEERWLCSFFHVMYFEEFHEIFHSFLGNKVSLILGSFCRLCLRPWQLHSRAWRFSQGHLFMVHVCDMQALQA